MGASKPTVGWKNYHETRPSPLATDGISQVLIQIASSCGGVCILSNTQGIAILHHYTRNQQILALDILQAHHQ